MRIASAALPLAGLLLLGFVPGAHAAGAAAAVGAPSPSFRLAGPADSVASDSLAGKLLYVDFWASWCEPCRRSFPWMREMHARYADKGLAIVAIDLDHDRAAGDKFLANFPAPFRVAFDPAGKSAEAFGVEGLPTSILIGRDGRVIERHVGFDPKSREAFEERIRMECAP